jgi:hypothetical protein
VSTAHSLGQGYADFVSWITRGGAYVKLSLSMSGEDRFVRAGIHTVLWFAMFFGSFFS